MAGVITSNDITGWNALTLSKNIKAKTVSCLEVMRAYLDHIEKTNPEVNAIVALQDHEELLSQAKTKDEELAGGSYNGWMHGFPHAAKDLALTLGIKTTLGSPLLKDYVPDVDQLIIERIKNEGAIIIGKTNVPEFGLGCQTFNSVYGTTSNPYDQAKTSGGSSGGAAVALALNMLPVADGSDFAGSLRNPASFNNVVGFRPSMGRVPYFPTNEVWSAPMGTEGPMARNVNDVAMLLSTMAGYDSRYPLSLKEDPNVFSNDLEADFNGTKIGWLGDLGGYLPIETGILEMCEKALKSFEDLGCHVENARPTQNPSLGWEAWLTLRNFQVGGLLKDFYDDPQKRDVLKPEIIWEIESYLKLSGDDIYQATKKRSTWYQSINQLFDTYDFLILPGSQTFPFDKNIHWPTQIEGVRMETYHQWMAIYCLITLTSCPVLNLPIGFNDKGLPMGLQIIGKNQSDLDILKVGYALEKCLDVKTP